MSFFFVTFFEMICKSVIAKHSKDVVLIILSSPPSFVWSIFVIHSGDEY